MNHESASEVFIRLQPAAPQGLAGALSAVEALGGRALSSYPPYAIVAMLPADQLESLRQSPGILAVHAGEIPLDPQPALPDVERLAIRAWNERVGRAPAAEVAPSHGPPWDAPGYLPPDRPSKRRRAHEEPAGRRRSQ